MQTALFIARNALKKTGEKARALGLKGRAAIVSDDNVYPLFGERLKESLESAGFTCSAVVFPHGERSKTLKTYACLLDRLSENGLSRADAVFALGGGVVGDTAGFAAATYLRGVPLVQVPTTLLAQVDASIGGKTGVDLAGGKNAAGAFYMPRLIISDPETLYTLPRAEILNGLAEEVKYAAITGSALLNLLPQKALSPRVIAGCAAYKQLVVSLDPEDRGVRRMLNFGHTAGHMLEKASGYALPHGWCVAAGIAIMARACALQGYCGEKDARALLDTLIRCRLPVRAPMPFEEAESALTADKKRAGDKLTLALFGGIGKVYLKTMPYLDARALLYRGWLC